MIVFDLICGDGHRFEGWFRSSEDFNTQCGNDQVSCPQCGSISVTKAPMAPAVPVKGNKRSEPIPASKAKPVSKNIPIINSELPPDVTKVLNKMAEVQARALKDSKWVGKDFTDRSRAMHYGEDEQQQIHGQATPEQAQDLLDEGISVAPLPFPVAPPEDVN